MSDGLSISIYHTLFLALPPRALQDLPANLAISDQESACLFRELLRSRAPLLLHLLRHKPEYSLVLSDLGALISDFMAENASDAPPDLVLEPWFQAHCESRGASRDCGYGDYREAVSAQESHWKTLTSALYGTSVCLGRCEHTELVVQAIVSCMYFEPFLKLMAEELSASQHFPATLTLPGIPYTVLYQ